MDETGDDCDKDVDNDGFGCSCWFLNQTTNNDDVSVIAIGVGNTIDNHRQWARTVLIVERGIAPAERLRQQDLYRLASLSLISLMIIFITVILISERNSSGNKCLVMKQFLSADQLDEIEEIIEMKVLLKVIVIIM